MSAGKERIIICGDCGAEVVTKYSRTRFCADCAKKREAIYTRKSREKKRAEERVKPERETSHLCDSPEKIKLCLNCEKPSCTNCLSGGYVPKENKSYKDEDVLFKDVKDEVIAFFKQGKTNVEVSALLDVSPKKVCKWKRRLKEKGLL